MSRLRSVGVGFAMAALLSATTPSVPVEAEPSGLYSIEIATWSLVAIDPASGATITVANVGGLAPNENLGPLVADDMTASLFTVMSSCNPCGFNPLVYQIVTIAGSTAAASPALATPVGPIAAEPGLNRLWAVTNCGACTNQSLITIDPSTGLQTAVATIPVSNYGPADSLAFAPESDTLFMSTGTGSPYLFALDTQTGVLGNAVPLTYGLQNIVFDSASQQLFGTITSFGAQQFVRVDPGTGAETSVASVSASYSVDNLAIDSLSHTVFADETNIFTEVETILSVNDQTGAMSNSSSAVSTIGTLAFMPPPTRVAFQRPASMPGPRGAAPQSQPPSVGTRPSLLRPLTGLRRGLHAGMQAADRLKPGYA